MTPEVLGAAAAVGVCLVVLVLILGGVLARDSRRVRRVDTCGYLLWLKARKEQPMRRGDGFLARVHGIIRRVDAFLEKEDSATLRRIQKAKADAVVDRYLAPDQDRLPEEPEEPAAFRAPLLGGRRP